jgi:ribosomal protein L37AE/L43A
VTAMSDDDGARKRRVAGRRDPGARSDWWNELTAQCRNHWREILIKLGIPSSFLSGRDCPCPMCGGKDRFRFSDRNGEGTWYCRGCGQERGQGGFKLAMRFRNTSAIETRELIEAIVGADAKPPKPKRAAFDGPASMPDPCERFESDAWAGLPLTSRRMLDVIETAWFRDSGRSAWLVITLGQFEARGVDRTMTKRARRDLLKRGLIDLAAQRCFDVLNFDPATFGPPEVLAGEVLAGRFEPISVLRFLEVIEQRQNRPPRGTSGPATAHPAKSQAKQPRWPKRAWRTVPKGWNKGRITVK